MAERKRPSKPRPKPEAGTPLAPSRALGSLKGEATDVRPRTRGRLKAKPPADGDEHVEPPKGRGPVKKVGPGPAPRSTRGKKTKPTVTKAAKAAAAARKEPGRRRAEDELPDQVPGRRRRSPGEGSGRYVRFRMRVEEGKMSIVDSHLVDSELMLPPTLYGEYAYEVTDGATVLHADSIPDLGVVRSFADPNGTREQLRHHAYRESTYEFDVRAPADQLVGAALSKISVVLYRVKEQAPTRALTTRVPLGTQFERELREVTRVSRIPPAALPSSLRKAPRRRSK
jgi:hypothetical protein